MKDTIKKWFGLLLCAGVMLSLNLGQTAAASANGANGVMQVQEGGLQHPRQSHSLTKVNDKIWVTGGKAYYSHYLGWDKLPQVKFKSTPNVEYIDLNTGKSVYTSLALDSAYAAATAFTARDDSPVIYLAAKQRVLKFDTVEMKTEELKNLGETADWSAGSYGRLEINGKIYVALVNNTKISFFDIEQEKFVKIEGIDHKIPLTEKVKSKIGARVLNNKLYLFGGTKYDDTAYNKAFVFDPAKPQGQQWSKLADIPMPMAFSNVEMVNGKFYLLGGIEIGSIFKLVFEYNPDTDSYVRKMDMPYESYNHGTTVIDGKIWISTGYSWGTAAENRAGFRMHPPHITVYNPVLDTETYALTARESVLGNAQNINITWPEPDKITGSKQTLAINWMAATTSTQGVVYYRKAGDKEFRQVVATGVNFAQGVKEERAYTALLQGLMPQQQYEYYVVSQGPAEVKSALNRFMTQPRQAEKFQFVAYGDTKAQYDVFNELNGDILRKLKEGQAKGLPGWFINLGDFASIDAFEEMEAWFNYGGPGRQYTKTLFESFPGVPVHGNHEGLGALYFNSFAFPKESMKQWPPLNNKGVEERWYSFNYGNVHFAVITTGTYKNEEWYKRQLDWLKADLEKARQEKQAGKIHWTILVQHNSVFTTGEHFVDQEHYGMFSAADFTTGYVDVVEENGAVDVVMYAHDHDYERSKNIAGYRWSAKGNHGKPGFFKRPDARAEEQSGRFGTATQGKGTIWITLAGAGAQQRDMHSLSKVGDSSWLAFRKPDIDKGETAAKNPCFNYSVFNVTRDELKIEVFEKNISYLPEWKGADDETDGLIDSVIIRR